jgi:hypothetical protein
LSTTADRLPTYAERRKETPLHPNCCGPCEDCREFLASREGERRPLRRRLTNGKWTELVFCHPERGTIYRAETHKRAFEAACKAAGIDDRMRPFHDARHTAITNDAASGSSPFAVMTKAGHSDMRTTKTYLHLAGTVFRDEAQALENRLLGGTKLYPSELTSDDLSESEPAEYAGSDLT